MSQRHGETREEFLARHREEERARKARKNAEDPVWVEKQRQKADPISQAEEREWRREKERERSRRKAAAAFQKDPDRDQRRRAEDPEWAERRREISRDSGMNQRINPVTRAKQVKSSRASKFGLTVEQLDALIEASGGVCGVCGTVPPPGKDGRDGLHVDHHHDTGAVRGMLCGRCNRALATLDLPVELLQKLIEWQARGSAGVRLVLVEPR